MYQLCTVSIFLLLMKGGVGLKGGGGLTVKTTLFDSRIKSVTRHAIIVNFYECVAPQMWPVPWYCDSVCTSWTISLKKRRPDILVSRGCFPFGGGILFVPNVTHQARKRSVCAGLKRGDPGNEIDQCLPRSAMLLFGFSVLCASWAVY